MLKVVAALAVGAILAGLGVHYARERLKSAVDHAVDTSLPTVVAEHPWDPVRHGRARRAEQVTFSGGAVSTMRCHTTLGTYSVSITHSFTFSPTTQPVPAHCPGRTVRRAMGLATEVRRTTSGHRQTLTLTDPQGSTVLVLVGRGD